MEARNARATGRGTRAMVTTRRECLAAVPLTLEMPGSGSGCQSGNSGRQWQARRDGLRRPGDRASPVESFMEPPARIEQRPVDYDVPNVSPGRTLCRGFRPPFALDRGNAEIPRFSESGRHGGQPVLTRSGQPATCVATRWISSALIFRDAPLRTSRGWSATTRSPQCHTNGATTV